MNALPQLSIALVLSACGGASKDSALDASDIGSLVPVVRDFRQVVPGEGLPPEVEPMDSNNNLDITWHEGRLYLAFRTGPDHFASEDPRMYVVSSTDEQNWRYEGMFDLDTDVREPQLVSWKGELHLWFAVLGKDPSAFEPQGARHTVYRGPGDWDPIEPAFPEDFIPWRIKDVDGRLTVTGYTGGGGVYDPEGGEPIKLRWLASDDGLEWTAAVPGHEVVHEGGASESDYVMLEDGSLVAVLRNEAGDHDGFGSKICTAKAKDLGTWHCRPDPRKYDSPLVFQREGKVWLVGRRTLNDDGLYDLGRDDLDRAAAYLLYQVTYWQNPKRCALWEVDPETRSVHWILDLESRGDTCFPEVVDLGEDVLLYNYSSPPDGPDLPWVEGQKATTQIYRQVLDFTP